MGAHNRAGRSPTFQDPGTPLNGLAGTRQFDAPGSQSHKGVHGESFNMDSYPRVWHGFRSTRVLHPGYPLPALAHTHAHTQEKPTQTIWTKEELKITEMQ